MPIDQGQYSGAIDTAATAQASVTAAAATIVEQNDDYDGDHDDE